MIGVALLAGALMLQLPAQVEGVVVDGTTGSGVAHATVSWRGGAEASERGARETGPVGRFTVPRQWSAGGTVEVSALGYRPLRLEVEAAAEAGWRLELMPDPLLLESIVFSAGPALRRRSEVAVPIVEIEEREIAVSGAESAERLLSDLPGLQSEPGTPVGSNIMIRGIGGPRVLVLLDGQPIGGALIENRDLSRLSLAGVERVEVVKGPLSSLYGSDALGGVINVITSDPEPELALSGRLMAGDHGRREGEATISGGGNVLYRVTGAWRQQDGLAGLAGDADAFSRVWDARSTVRWSSPKVALRSDLSFVRERQRWPVGGGFSGFNDNRGVSAWAEVETSGVGGVWKARLLGQDYDHLYRSARGDAPIAGADGDRQVERLWEGSLTYSRQTASNALDLGVEVADRFIRSPDKVLENQASDREFGLFAQNAIHVGRTTFTGGARWTLNDSWGNALSPSLGISSLLGDRVRVQASVGRGFRAPSFKELAWDFANLGAGYTVEGNPELRSERSWNVSGAVEWAAAPSVTLSAEVFQNEVEDLIDLALIGTTNGGLQVYSPSNINRARTRGVELGAAIRRTGWSSSLSYAYLDARSFPGGLPLDRRAPHTTRFRLTAMPERFDRFQLDFTGHWTAAAPLVGVDSEGRTARLGTRDDLTALDLHLSFRTVGDLRIVLGGDNLLDQSPEGWPAVIGRRLRVGLEMR